MRERNLGATLGATKLIAPLDTTHAAPADQPTSIRQITDRLFPAYTIDGGSVHLAGCRLEDRIFLRLDFCRAESRTELYADLEGRPVDAELAGALGMAETIRLAAPAGSMESDLSRALHRGTRLAEERLSGSGPPELMAVTVLWCKYAQGKLRFTIGEHIAELPFSGWARLIQPPPFVCAYTGQSTFHLAATDDGRIVAAEAIGICAETGRRLLANELVTCAATGRRVSAELIATCPVTADYVLQSQMVRCSTCRELVSPTAVRRGQCAACRQLHAVDRADSRLAGLLDAYPRLVRWRRWRLAETADVYVVAATDWLKRLLLVVDKRSLKVKLAATARRFLPRWQIVEAAEQDSLLCG